MSKNHDRYSKGPDADMVEDLSSTKKNARRALKKKENPAPKCDKDPIEYASSVRQFGQQLPTQQKSGSGKNLKKATKTLAKMSANGMENSRKYRRLSEKRDRLENALQSKEKSNE